MGRKMKRMSGIERRKGKKDEDGGVGRKVKMEE